MQKLGRLLTFIALIPGMLFASTEGTVSYERFQRINTPAQKTGSDNWLMGSVDYDMDRQYIKGKVDADLRYFTKNSDINASVAETYLEYHGDDNIFAMGRKLIEWNPNEKFWQLGHINGLRNFRLLDEKQEGLLGFHYKNKAGWIKTQVFLSYFYIPTLNPGIDVENGNVTSNSEWVKLPPTRTIVAGRQVPIRYTLNKPEPREVIMQKSLGMSLSTDWTGGKFTAFTIYKPENNLRINAEGNYDLKTDRVNVTANPIVNHHMVYGGTIEQKIDEVELVGGWIWMDPNAKLGSDFDAVSLDVGENNRSFDSDFFKIEPKYDQEGYVHASATINRPTYSLGVNGIQYLTKHERGSDDFYSDTVKWKQAAGINFGYALTDQWKATTKYQYDFQRKDNIFSAETTYDFARHFRAGLGLEMIKSPSTESYWSAFRANDTIYTQIGYLF